MVRRPWAVLTTAWPGSTQCSTCSVISRRRQQTSLSHAYPGKWAGSVWISPFPPSCSLLRPFVVRALREITAGDFASRNLPWPRDRKALAAELFGVGSLFVLHAGSYEVRDSIAEVDQLDLRSMHANPSAGQTRLSTSRSIDQRRHGARVEQEPKRISEHLMIRHNSPNARRQR